MTATTAPSRTMREAVGRLFAGVPVVGPPTVGIELELIPYRIADHGVVPVEELLTALREVSYVCFEPGGQIELNPAPQPTVTEACEQLESLWERVHGLLGPIGVTTAATGLNRWHTVDELGLQLRTERYLAMDDYFLHIGPAGRSFMRQTASTQICLGLAEGSDGLYQWQAANLVAPVLAAMFANSPVGEGRDGGRTAICRAADPGRTRHGRPPLTVDEYVEFASGARPLDSSYVGDVAIERHLSTLFSPVRPRGRYLEFRAIDALPMVEIRTATVLLACLLSEPASAQAVTRACSVLDGPTLWDYAEAGCQALAVRELALDLIEIAAWAAKRLPTLYLPADALDSLDALARRVAVGLTPARSTTPPLPGVRERGL